MMPEEALSSFRHYKDSAHLNLAGIHLHIGSQNPSSAAYAEALEILFLNLRRIYSETGIRLSHINLGGGFPVNYLNDDLPGDRLPLEQVEMFSADFEPADAIRNAWETVTRAAESANASKLLENITLLLEPGRSIIADAGILLTTVRNIKTRPLSNSAFRTPHDELERWLLTDAGFNLLLSMVTYNWYYHLISAERAGEAHDFPYKVAGPLCDGGDVFFDIEGRGRLPEHRLLPENVRLGEVLAMLNCGAYTLAQASQYNGRFLPPVVLIDPDAKPQLIRKRDTLRDLTNNDL
jgi:diaminopimelate decarboxylase